MIKNFDVIKSKNKVGKKNELVILGNSTNEKMCTISIESIFLRPKRKLSLINKRAIQMSFHQDKKRKRKT